MFKKNSNNISIYIIYIKIYFNIGDIFLLHVKKRYLFIPLEVYFVYVHILMITFKFYFFNYP